MFIFQKPKILFYKHHKERDRYLSWSRLRFFMILEETITSYLGYGCTLTSVRSCFFVHYLCSQDNNFAWTLGIITFSAFYGFN